MFQRTSWPVFQVASSSAYLVLLVCGFIIGDGTPAIPTVLELISGKFLRHCQTFIDGESQDTRTAEIRRKAGIKG